MKMTTSYNLTKKNDQGEELTVNLVVEDEVNGQYSRQEMKERMQAETKALQEALNLRQQAPRMIPYEPKKQENLLTNTAKTQESKGEWKATDKLIIMINTIVPKMNKTVQDICQEYKVPAVENLTYQQVNKIKKEYDEYAKKINK